MYIYNHHTIYISLYLYIFLHMYSNNSSSARSKPGALTMASATRLTWWVAWWAPWQPSATRPYWGMARGYTGCM